MSEIKRETVTGKDRDKRIEALQAILCDLIATLSRSSVGRATVVDEKSRLESFPQRLQSAASLVTIYVDRPVATIGRLHDRIASAANHDSINEYRHTGISGTLEKCLGMLQSQELAK